MRHNISKYSTFEHIWIGYSWVLFDSNDNNICMITFSNLLHQLIVYSIYHPIIHLNGVEYTELQKVNA